MNQEFLFDKYLSLIGAKVTSPSFELLCKIIKAHLIRIPFENISKLLFKKDGIKVIPNLSNYLEGIEKYNFGGTCYSNNYYLYLLLKHLGFDIKLCGADMKNPDVHLISIVNLNDGEFIVDCGYGAPFYKPLPRDLYSEYIIKSGNEKYIVRPKDELGRTKVEQYYYDQLQHWYIAKPHPREIENFYGVIEQSYRDDAIFMNSIRISKFSENGALVLKNQELTETLGPDSSRIEISKKDLPKIIQNRFGIPKYVVEKAIINLINLKSIYD